jgi:hypothetical protein
MLRNGFLCRGGGELAHIGWNQIHPAKREKMFRKVFEHFCHAIMFRWPPPPEAHLVQFFVGEVNENKTLPSAALRPFYLALTTSKSMVNNGIIALLSQLSGKRQPK